MKLIKRKRKKNPPEETVLPEVNLVSDSVGEEESPSFSLEEVLEDPVKPPAVKPPDPQATEIFTCSGCGSTHLIREMRKVLYVCPECGKHHKISARRRMRNLMDPGSFRKLRTPVPMVNPLDYPEYEDKIRSLQEKTGMDEGILSGIGEIEGQKTVAVIMGSEFLMGSMGIAVGEKVTRAFEIAEKAKLPIIIFAASGGARMQEGILSLMQMAKTSAAVKRFSDNGGLYISVLTHPTTGGVSASFATLADITLAEPDALIGFAGPRVIEQTIGQKLPEGFQRAEYLETHGFVDAIVKRQDMRSTLSLLLRLHQNKRRPRL
ncbi:MAG: acetyl-CoA carboxylase carboxyltransferase subunit beta [Eubacterium sp.]|nr:acetyl-CoA carboxylase carboxyltransferase subunit beta [Eubacterium sp.]